MSAVTEDSGRFLHGPVRMMQPEDRSENDPESNFQSLDLRALSAGLRGVRSHPKAATAVPLRNGCGFDL